MLVARGTAAAPGRGGSAGGVRHGAAELPTRTGRASRRGRRRPGARAHRQAGLPATRPSRPASWRRATRARRRPARRRPGPDGRHRRPPSRLQRRHDELRARADDGAARRRHRLGLDGGGSSSLAFDGKLLNRPSDRGGERPVSNALQLVYYGVYAPPPEPVISPNGDGVAEQQRELSYKVVRPSNVTAPWSRPTAPSRSPRRWHAIRARTGRVPARPADPTVVDPAPPAEGPGARRHGHRRPRPDLDDEPDVHGQQHARLREVSRRPSRCVSGASRRSRRESR